MRLQQSSSTSNMPGGRFASINSHTTLLLKYFTSFHSMPSRTCVEHFCHSGPNGPVKPPPRDGTPRAHVLLLLRFQRQGDEDLLQFFIDEIYGELLEAVPLEDLEAVDVQHADRQQLLIIFILDARI